MAKIATCFFLIAMVIIGLACVSSAARVLLEEPDLGTTITTYEDDTTSSSSPSSSSLSSSSSAVATPSEATTTVDDDDDVVADAPLPDDVVAPVVAADVATPPAADTSSDDVAAPAVVADVATPPAADTSSDDVAAPNVGVGQQPDMTFFMHDIVGGSHPTVRTVTGVVTATNLNAVPFSTPNNNIFPLTGGVPLLNGNGANPNLNQLINNNNLPYLTGLNPGGIKPSTIIQSNGNQVSGGNNQPFVTAGQLPAGATLQSLMFGTITVIDDELSEGHELGSSVLGKAQGLYIASSLDGTSHTMAITLMFHNKENDKEMVDTISLFGVHRTVSADSQVAIVGGTGKYEHAKGYATVETLPQVDQHTTDGLDSIFEFNVYFTPVDE